MFTACNLARDYIFDHPPPRFADVILSDWLTRNVVAKHSRKQKVKLGDSGFIVFDDIHVRQVFPGMRANTCLFEQLPLCRVHCGFTEI